jgi:hypothetical protein
VVTRGSRHEGVAGRLSRTDRRRLIDRVDELGQLADLMRGGTSLAAPDEPLPLHRLHAAPAAIQPSTRRPAPGRHPQEGPP